MLFAGLLFSIAFEYVNPGAWVPIIKATKIGTIVPLLVFLAVFFQSEPVSNGRLLKHANTKWLIFFLLLISLSVLISTVQMRAFDVFRAVLGYVFWYVIISKVICDLGKLLTFFRVLVFSHILVLVLNPAVVLEPATRSYLRAGPFLGDGNDFALSVSVVLPMCLVLLNATTNKTAKIVYTIAAAILVLAIIGTQSRGGTLALVASLGFLWWVSSRRFAGLVVLGFLSIGVLMFAPPQYFERMESIANYEQESSANARITAWKAGVRMATAHPFAGVGAGHFPVAMGRNFKPPEWGGRNLPWMTAHSSYFLILGELGIPGIVFFVSLLAGNFFRLRRLRMETKDDCRQFYDVFEKLSASVIAFAIGGAFLSAAYYPHIFVLAGLITAVTLTYQRSMQEP